MPVDTEELISRFTIESHQCVDRRGYVPAASGIPTFRGDDGLWRQFQGRGTGHAGSVCHEPAAGVGRARLAARDRLPVRTRHTKCSSECTTRFHTDHAERGRPSQRARRHPPHDQVSRFDPGVAPCRRVRRARLENRDAPLESLPPLCPRGGTLVRRGLFGDIDPRFLERSQPPWPVPTCSFRSAHPRSSTRRRLLLHHASCNGAFTVEINPGATDVSRVVDLPIAAPAEDARNARRQNQDGQRRVTGRGHQIRGSVTSCWRRVLGVLLVGL